MPKTTRSRTHAAKRKRYGNPAAQAEYQAHKVAERYPSGYRMSKQFINLISTVLGISMLALVGIGFLIGFVFSGAGDWVGPTAITLILGGIGIPFLIAAWLGGQALHRFGGPVGLLLTIGFAGTVFGLTYHQPIYSYSGGGAILLSVLLFWFMGWKAKVPMFLGERRIF